MAFFREISPNNKLNNNIMTQLSFLRSISKAVQQLNHKNHLLLHQKIRFCSSLPPHVLHSQSFNVPSFGGSLWIKSHYNVHVQPTNTMDYPNLDQAFVKVNMILCVHYAHTTDDSTVCVRQAHVFMITFFATKSHVFLLSDKYF